MIAAQHLGNRTCDERCGRARSPKSSCTCVCGGREHGALLVVNPEVAAATAARFAADPFAGIPQLDEEPF